MRETARMHTIELTDEELRLVRAALHGYLDDFGHDQAELLREIKTLTAKLPQPLGRHQGLEGHQSDVTEL